MKFSEKIVKEQYIGKVFERYHDGSNKQKNKYKHSIVMGVT